MICDSAKATRCRNWSVPPSAWDQNDSYVSLVETFPIASRALMKSTWLARGSENWLVIQLSICGSGEPASA
jgi:hypothetical protein